MEHGALPWFDIICRVGFTSSFGAKVLDILALFYSVRPGISLLVHGCSVMGFEFGVLSDFGRVYKCGPRQVVTEKEGFGREMELDLQLILTTSRLLFPFPRCTFRLYQVLLLLLLLHINMTP